MNDRAITYLSGAVRAEALGRRSDFGILLTPLMGNVPQPYPGMHAHDNGVFTEMKTKGKKAFNRDRFLRHLDLWRNVKHMALFAVAPDVIEPWQATCGHEGCPPWKATLERSAPILPLIRARGYRAALVAQNGLEQHMDLIPWDDFDVLFVGGGKDKRYVRKGNPQGEWKWTQGARRLIAEARRRGKDVHVGRVNSLLRLRQAQEWGATSADGTIIAFGPDIRTPEVQGWLNTLNPARSLVARNCFICRWHAQGIVNTYAGKTIDGVLGSVDCPHTWTPSAPRPLQLPVREQLPLAA